MSAAVEESLPRYTATAAPGATPAPDHNDTHGELPIYTFPASFSVGGKTTEGILVDVPQIKGHLALLSAFASLREELGELTGHTLQMPFDQEKRWAWFVGLAAERFDLWCRSLETKDSLQPLEDTLPPLDVLMVWHSYMLNPRWYAEDGQRIDTCKPLFELGETFGKELHRLPEILDAPPNDTRVTTFMRRVGLPFEPLQSARVSVNKSITCPKWQTVVVVPYMTTPGTGYLQQRFQQKCWGSQGCITITKDSLCARKLAENLSRHKLGPSIYLPGMCLMNSGKSTQAESLKIMAEFRHKYKTTNSDAPINEEMCLAILEDCHYSLAELRSKLGRHKLLGRIMSAHASPMAYSVELVGAVLRQGSFITKMASLEWTKPGYFNAPDDELALQHAIARYHAFLDLLSSSPASFFVPTLDIDLVWHTHQLSAAKYKTDTERYVGRFIDHDDKVSAPELSSSFDLTCRAWQNRFNLPYTHCGCPLPGSTIGQRLSRLMSSKQYDLPPSQLVPPAHRADAIAATHASEHNSVQFVARNRAALRNERFKHREHAAKMQKRAKREAEKERKQAEKERKEQLERERERRDPNSCGYGIAFMLPVPIYYGGGGGGGMVCVVVERVALGDVGLEDVAGAGMEVEMEVEVEETEVEEEMEEAGEDAVVVSRFADDD